MGSPLLVRITDSEERGGFTARLTVENQFDGDVLLASTYDVRLHEPPWLIDNLINTLTEINRFIDARVLPAVTTLL